MGTEPMGTEPILSIKRSVSIDTMLNLTETVTGTEMDMVPVNRPLFLHSPTPRQILIN